MHHAPEKLKEEGHKLTPQRLLIWHILSEGTHCTANQIHKKAKEQFPGVDLATVYRTLELLVKRGLVQENKFPDSPVQFEVTESIGHKHIVCRKCGKVEHFKSESLLNAISEVCKSHGFNSNSTEINLSSICNNCLEKDN